MANGTIAFDTLSTSGQISGTAKSVDTDYVVNGSAKAWSLTASDASLDDSFNFGSGTDNGTGDYTVAFSSNMSNATYAVPATMAEDASVFTINKARATSSVRMFNVRHDNVSSVKKQCYAVHGDLA